MRVPFRIQVGLVARLGAGGGLRRGATTELGKAAGLPDAGFTVRRLARLVRLHVHAAYAAGDEVTHDAGDEADGAHHGPPGDGPYPASGPGPLAG